MSARYFWSPLTLVRLEDKLETRAGRTVVQDMAKRPPCGAERYRRRSSTGPTSRARPIEASSFLDCAVELCRGAGRCSRAA